MAGTVLRTKSVGSGSYTLKHTGPQIDALLTKTEGLYNYDDSELRSLIGILEQTKVTKVEGKGLSTNDFTDELLQELESSNSEVVEARGDYPDLNSRLNAISGGGTSDYMDLTNKPSINGHVLVGDLNTEALGIEQVQVDWNQISPSAVDYIKNKPDITTFLYDTTAAWNAQPSLVSKQKTIYVYTDYQLDDEGNNVPGFKVGDGVTRLFKLPFTGSEGGVSDSERRSWNDKVTAFIDPEDYENLVLSKA